MTGLDELPIERRYRTGENDLVKDFYLPCLERAREYDRAVGYFTSGSFALAAPALIPFIKNGGRMRLVVSPHLTNADVTAMVAGYERRKVISTALCREVTNAEIPDPVRDSLGCLSWLIANDRLDVKVAVMSDARETGIYHEKLGIFRDDSGTCIAFQGSANESINGLEANFESVLVFSTARDADRTTAEQLVDDFERLWNGQVRALDLISLPEAVKQTLIQTYPPERITKSIERSEHKDTAPSPGPPPKLRDYQQKAMVAWFRNRGRGILEMATGTGKTTTALATASQLVEEQAKIGKGLAIVILCPFQHLVTQWTAEAALFGFRPIECFRSFTQWEDEARVQILELTAGARKNIMLVATNATFSTQRFQRILEDLPATSLLIADEMHNLGSPSQRSLLPQDFDFRLGLSATPERHRDSEGTMALQHYFGDPVFQLTLQDAIRLGALTPYRYSPIVIELQDEEVERYLELSEQIALRMAICGDDSDDDEQLMSLLIKRARLIGTAKGKLPRLIEILRPRRKSTHNLVYCGDGRPMEEDRAGERQVEGVVRALGTELGMAVNRYTSEVSIEQRATLRERFAAGSLNALVAIRCLDEGVDIPETQSAFILASSTNPRQFIQRRGRVLRPAPGKDFAEIFDFIVVPPNFERDDINQAERRLISQELTRVVEFAGSALNGPEAVETLRDIRIRFDLRHLGA